MQKKTKGHEKNNQTHQFESRFHHFKTCNLYIYIYITYIGTIFLVNDSMICRGPCFTRGLKHFWADNIEKD